MKHKLNMLEPGVKMLAAFGHCDSHRTAFFDEDIIGDIKRSDIFVDIRKLFELSGSRHDVGSHGDTLDTVTVRQVVVLELWHELRHLTQRHPLPWM